MDTTALITFLTALFFLEITPGPDMMLVLARGIGQGQRIALLTAVGQIFVSGTVQVALLVLGVASPLQVHPSGPGHAGSRLAPAFDQRFGRNGRRPDETHRLLPGRPVHAAGDCSSRLVSIPCSPLSVPWTIRTRTLHHPDPVSPPLPTVGTLSALPPQVSYSIIGRP